MVNEMSGIKLIITLIIRHTNVVSFLRQRLSGSRQRSLKCQKLSKENWGSHNSSNKTTINNCEQCSSKKTFDGTFRT